jgi:hypothetical protein
MAEEDLVAFNQRDADAVLDLIDSTVETSLYSTQRPRRGIKWGKSKSTGMAANSVADVILREVTSTGWADGPDIEAWNQGVAIPANKLLLLIPIDGRLCALQVEC